ncbi:hypothetical protein [Trueperella sp.]|uniref:hypothetical protein n=1 Tax=Trueperella sp. TaxID=2699835 RepID=UPI0022EA277E|nr:hypothetical protein [Trueperella sp.]
MGGDESPDRGAGRRRGGAFLNVQPIFGELAKDPAFRRDYLAAFEVIRDHGVRAPLEKMA